MGVEEARETGFRLIGAHNALVVRSIDSVETDRMRPVALLLTDTLEQMMSQLRYLIDHGAKGFWMPSGNPPAQTSPTDEALDPFWRLAAENDIVVLLHLGTDEALTSPQWTDNVPAFVPTVASVEFPLSPLAGAGAHVGVERFITAVTLGGVFERLPNLRVGPSS